MGVVPASRRSFLLLIALSLPAFAYTVNDLGDAPDQTPGDNICATSGAVWGTLGIAVRGSKVGVNRIGTAALPNAQSRVDCHNSGCDFQDDVISGNGTDGIKFVSGGSITIQTSTIGLGTDGARSPATRSTAWSGRRSARSTSTATRSASIRHRTRAAGKWPGWSFADVLGPGHDRAVAARARQEHGNCRRG